jgi:hypothetical protein
LELWKSTHDPHFVLEVVAKTPSQGTAVTSEKQAERAGILVGQKHVYVARHVDLSGPTGAFFPRIVKTLLPLLRTESGAQSQTFYK